MKINNQSYHTIWRDKNDPYKVHCIDQRFLPFRFVTEELRNLDEVITAIKDMHLRGAPLIGVAAAYGMFLAAKEIGQKSDINHLKKAAERLLATRPTAINLQMALDRQMKIADRVNANQQLAEELLKGAEELKQEEIENCMNIGRFGLPIIEKLSREKKGGTVNILTHCNAGWLACIDYGTATAPIYMAHDKGIKIHVWVDETRPRNQGARLTAWELGQQGVPHTVIADNTGGHLMQQGKVDMVIVGTDRTSPNGDVANKIGTYLKALAAKDNNIPFYAAVPSTSIDWNINDAFREIPIEERDAGEVHFIEGWDGDAIKQVKITPEGSKAVNYGFDITPARLVTGIITERGCCKASREGLSSLFPEFF
jgi:methylthioribose-1-phosphate isomerase